MWVPHKRTKPACICRSHLSGQLAQNEQLQAQHNVRDSRGAPARCRKCHDNNAGTSRNPGTAVSVPRLQADWLIAANGWVQVDWVNDQGGKGTIIDSGQKWQRAARAVRERES